MDLKTSLLQERERVVKELADIENLLASRCGWKPPTADESRVSADAPDSSPPVGKSASELNLAAPSTGASDRVDDKSQSIPYAIEVKNWLETFQVGAHLSAVDFRDWLDKKYPGTVNESSVRGPFKRLEQSGQIVTHRAGSGRSPTIYRKA
jgi:hypothetical protein